MNFQAKEGLLAWGAGILGRTPGQKELLRSCGERAADGGAFRKAGGAYKKGDMVKARSGHSSFPREIPEAWSWQNHDEASRKRKAAGVIKEDVIRCEGTQREGNAMLKHVSCREGEGAKQKP